MVKQIAVSEETNEIAIKYAKEHKISKKEITEYLYDLLEKHNLLDPDWKEKITEFSLADYLIKHDQDFAKKVELKKIDAINRAKLYAFQEYIKTLDPDVKKSFLENLLGKSNLEQGNILERFSESTVFTIDGKKKMCRESQDGKPILLGVAPERIIECEFGHHVKGEYCSCSKWRTCPIRKEEYSNYLAETDPLMKRDATKRFANRGFRGDRRY
jgi:hypothetical protein